MKNNNMMREFKNYEEAMAAVKAKEAKGAKVHSVVFEHPELKKFARLNCSVTITVPGTIKVNEISDNTQYVDRTIGQLSTIFGGASAAKVKGGWMSDTEGLVLEHNVDVTASCDEETLYNNVPQVLKICRELRDELSQECISLQINGERMFI